VTSSWRATARWSRGDAVSAIVASGLLPGAIEIMDALALEAAKAAVHADYPPHCEAVLIVELEGPREAVAADRLRLDALLAASGPVEARPARNPAERLAIWKGRKSAFSAVGRLSPDFIVQDGVVPRRRLGESLRRIGEFSREAGLRCANVFHAGDGNLHPLILYNGRNPGELERAEALAGRILRLCVDMGGSITGEHGIGVEKRDYLPAMFAPDEIDCLQRIRAAFDPLGIANPGKMFPDGEAPAPRPRSASARTGRVISRENGGHTRPTAEGSSCLLRPAGPRLELGQTALSRGRRRPRHFTVRFSCLSMSPTSTRSLPAGTRCAT
jgi:glycolate oxidase